MYRDLQLRPVIFLLAGEFDRVNRRSFCRLNTSFIIKEVSVGAVQLSGTVTL